MAKFLEISYQLNPELTPGYPDNMPAIKVVQRRRQKNLRINIRKSNVVVSGPATASRSAILDFVLEKREWIQKNFLKQHNRIENLRKMKDELHGTILLRGERKNIYDFPVPGLRKPRLVEHDQAVVFQYDPLSLERVQPTQHQAKVATEPCDGFRPAPDPGLIHSFCLEIAKKELRERFDDITKRLNFKPSGLTIRNQRTKWGSCSARGMISLNWRLIKCPPFIMDYIIIHELCHLKHFNHSKAFWTTVRFYFKEVKQAKEWIRENAEVIFADF